MFPLEGPLNLPPSLLSGPRYLFHLRAYDLENRQLFGKNLLLFKQRLRVSFRITRRLTSTSVLRHVRFSSPNVRRRKLLKSPSMQAKNAPATSGKFHVVSDDNRGELML